ncbi:MAG: TIGR03618 family F420-dependent PPOX class oxidoreductase [Chloroflexi bacterium]|nr:MAG: TIGR03618 family F420-dependent PPOX class oxidoreductase [Chloroflexota bacterium]TMF36531.1 MAG: TIGR03618 family F420-dependent PPOX class oxidoreductase [Chloroflexota bacterium]
MGHEDKLEQSSHGRRSRESGCFTSPPSGEVGGEVAGRRQTLRIPDTAFEVLGSGRLAHIVTLNPDGSPQMSCVWVGVDDGEIVLASLPRNRKVRNIERDPRVILSIETGRKGRNGLDEYLVVAGRGRVVQGGAPEVLQRLAHVYMGPTAKFPPMPNPPPGFVIRIEPQRFSGNGPWND